MSWETRELRRAWQLQHLFFLLKKQGEILLCLTRLGKQQKSETSFVDA